MQWALQSAISHGKDQGQERVFAKSEEGLTNPGVVGGLAAGALLGGVVDVAGALAGATEGGSTSPDEELVGGTVGGAADVEVGGVA